MFVARQTEFIIRRCFLPYALLAFAVLNILHLAFIVTAVGANLVWTIALYTYWKVSKPMSHRVSPATQKRKRQRVSVAVLISAHEAD